MQHELHAASLVEETFGNDRPVCRQCPQACGTSPHVGHALLGAGLVQPALSHEKGNRLSLVGLSVWEPAVRPGRSVRRGGWVERARDPLPYPRHLVRQLGGAAGGLASPEGDRRRRAVGVLDSHTTRLHASDAPGGRAQQEHIAGQAFDRKVLVHGSHRGAFRFRDHEVVGVVRNRAARRDRREPRPPPTPHDAIHLISMQIGAASSALGRDAI